MLLNKVLKISTLFMGLSLAACIEPTGQATQQPVAASVVNDAPVVTASQTSTEQNPIVTPNFRSGGGNWEGFGSILIRYTAIERNGEVYVCGVFTARGGTSIRSLTREVMRQASVTANGQTIMRNLRFFKEASNATYSRAMVGSETNCRSTGRAIGTIALETVIVEIRSGNYRVRR